MIDPGVCSLQKVSEWQSSQLGNGIISRRFTCANSFDERPQRVFIHRPIVAKIPKISSVGRILW